MAFIEQLLAIIRNTFFESIRQPIMLIVLMAATIAIVLSNPLSAFTMDNDQRMLIDLGMATVFLCGALLAALIATNVLTREIENKTALTVISKPVGRPVFVIGKFIGVAFAIGLGTLYMSLVFMIVEMHTVLETVRDPIHTPVIVFGVSAMLLGLAAAVWCNYFYNMVFASTVLCITTPLMALAYIASMMFRPDFTTQSMAVSWKPELWLGLIAMTAAILILAAIAIAASTRLGQVMTLVVTLGAFVLGLLSNWIFGRRIESLRETWLDRAQAQGLTNAEEVTRTIELSSGVVTAPEVTTVQVPTVPLTDMAENSERLDYAISNVGYALVPNLESLSLTDALTQGHMIPTSYVVMACVYSAVCIIGILSVAVILFQRREVG